MDGYYRVAVKGLDIPSFVHLPCCSCVVMGRANKQYNLSAVEPDLVGPKMSVFERYYMRSSNQFHRLGFGGNS